MFNVKKLGEDVWVAENSKENEVIIFLSGLLKKSEGPEALKAARAYMAFENDFENEEIDKLSEACSEKFADYLNDDFLMFGSED